MTWSPKIAPLLRDISWLTVAPDLSTPQKAFDRTHAPSPDRPSFTHGKSQGRPYAREAAAIRSGTEPPPELPTPQRSFGYFMKALATKDLQLFADIVTSTAKDAYERAIRETGISWGDILAWLSFYYPPRPPRRVELGAEVDRRIIGEEEHRTFAVINHGKGGPPPNLIFVSRAAAKRPRWRCQPPT